MSAIADQDEVTPNLADLDVPMSDAAPDPGSDYNAEPPALPELYDENGKQVPYIIDLMLGKDGIKKETYDEKDNGQPTGKKGVYFTADVLGKAVGALDQREMDLAYFNAFLRPSQRYTSFVRKGKGLSEIAHLGKVAGFDITQFQTVGELAADLAQELRKKGEGRVQALAYIQWQWYSKETEFTKANGDTKKGKVVRYGMKNADVQLPDGSYAVSITHKDTGEQLTARAVITRIEALP